MKRRLGQWVFLTGFVCTVALAALLLFEASIADYYFDLLGPWHDLCATVTPEEWQIQGNILLGLIWIFAGVLAYSMIIGLCCVILLAFAQGLFKRILGGRTHEAK